MSAEHITETLPGSRLIAEQAEKLEEDGYVVLPGILSEAECDLWSGVVDDLWEQLRAAPHDFTEEPGVQFTQNLLRHSAMFEPCLTQPAMAEAVRTVLGEGYLLTVINGRRAEPGSGNQPLHDLKRSRGKPFHCCDAIWCLDEFTPLNGTRLIPGSHLRDAEFLARMTDPASPHPDELIVEAPRGAVLVFNGHLIHGGSTNRGAGPRRSIQTAFVAKGRKPQYDWTALPHQVRDTLRPEARRVLGLEG